MYELKTKGLRVRNGGNGLICFKIDNVSPEFLVNVPGFNAYNMKSTHKNHMYE